MKADVAFLASPRCEGRGPTTKGINRAADYIAARFKEIGLKPGFKGSYFQPFRIPGAEGKLVLTGPQGQRVEPSPNPHFRPLGMDQKGDVTGGVVFAGFGIRSAGYDDYDGLDVKGKVVVVLRDTPRPNDPKTGPALREFAPLVRKLATAEKLGAKAVLVVNDRESAAGGDRLLDYSTSFLNSRGGPHLPAFAVRRELVERMLPAGVTLDELERRIHRDLKPASLELEGWTVTLKVAPRRDLIPLKNVVGVLEGAGPLANETVVIGAHYDHLGYGGPSSLATAKVPQPHVGADDNASGTSGMIELARRFAAQGPGRQGRRVLFIAFSGEEINLLGSRHYCRNPIFPLAETAAMLNLDMIGRLRPDRKTGKDRLLVQGTGSAKPFKELIDNLAQKYAFAVANQASGDGPSDHAEFYGKKVPVLFLWTDTHRDYHRPSDTADKLNVSGMRKVVDAAEEVARAFATMEKPAYVYVPGSNMARPTKGPRLGIRPSYFSDVEGLEVDGVSPEGPADRAGMQDEDVILSIADRPVRNMATYMQAMALQKKGTTIEVVVLRKGERKTLKVKLD
jgi:hypothetical protein